MTRKLGALVAIAAVIAACGGGSSSSADDTSHVMAFDTAPVRMATRRDTLRLSLELARRPEQRTMGLMERRQLAENAGMLFLYDSTQSKDAAFWMYRTRIPLDIAFLDSSGVVRSIVAMVPCTATLAQGCPSYPPNVPYRYALEMNAGFFAQHQVGVGDVLLVRDIPAAR
jgi:uncharacterized membrane protein (UPF0127 family)